jgi:hypothetical protein
MITAIVLLCTTKLPIACTYQTYPNMIATEQECRELIFKHNAEGIFIVDIAGRTYVLTDYMCINWNNKRI